MLENVYKKYDTIVRLWDEQGKHMRQQLTWLDTYIKLRLRRFKLVKLINKTGDSHVKLVK